MPSHMADLAEAALRRAGIPLSSARIAILGYAFLEESDDTRNTPARPLIDELRRRGAKSIVVHDPFVREEELSGVKRDLLETLRGCHCACLLTAHTAYKKADLAQLTRAMAHPLIIDGRNALGNPPPSLQVITIGRSYAQR
jgi:UDP-N-acetyl-D-mannosaminuronic acid dehydrogenase